MKVSGMVKKDAGTAFWYITSTCIQNRLTWQRLTWHPF